MSFKHGRNWQILLLTALASLAGGGCVTARPGTHLYAPQYEPCQSLVIPADNCIPRELDKTAMPEYVIEVSDILLIDAISVSPKPPYRIGTLDQLTIRVEVTSKTTGLSEVQLDSDYAVLPGGSLDLSPFGSVLVKGKTIEEARQAIEMTMRQHVADPVVTVGLAATAGQQQIAGEHMVIQDGTVNLGVYGKLYVTGMTEAEAREAIEAHLEQFLEDPQVSVDVFAFNSKKFYIVTEGGGLGDGVYPFPITGNETVLDAISQVNGLDSVASARIWIARPAPRGQGYAQVLPVDWYAITRLADTSTNYQLMPGDRLYVAADKLVKLDTMMAKIIAPFERLMGATLLTTSTVSRLEFYRNFGQRGGAAAVIQP